MHSQPSSPALSPGSSLASRAPRASGRSPEASTPSGKTAQRARRGRARGIAGCGPRPHYPRENGTFRSATRGGAAAGKPSISSGREDWTQPRESGMPGAALRESQQHAVPPLRLRRPRTNGRALRDQSEPISSRAPTLGGRAHKGRG